MGIERYFTAFLGFEISSFGSIWDSRTCISFRKEHHINNEEYASNEIGIFRKQVSSYEAMKGTSDGVSTKNSSASFDTAFIQDAVFKMVDNTGKEAFDKWTKSPRNLLVEKSNTSLVSKREKTYLQYQNNTQLGSQLDFRA
ncbi:MAG: hypothetical protein WD357_11495 [Gracilimonas sp.]